MTLGSLFIPVLLSFSALAQESTDDEFDLDFEEEEIVFDDDEEESEDEEDTTEEASTEEAEDTAEEPDLDALDDAALDFEDPDEGEFDLLGDEEPELQGDADTEAHYRNTARDLAELGPDEEILAWRAYLEEFPETVFRKRIEARIDELTDQLYDTSIGGDQTVDAMRQEIGLAQPVLLENVDPRDRLQVGFEFGFPRYGSLVADFEKQASRKLSFHVGLRGRYDGLNFELGPRWAMVKSTRTSTLVTFIGDVRISAAPFFPAVRPQLALGKRMGKVDFQIQGGADIEFRSIERLTGTSMVPQTRIVGGASAFLRASERVGVFAETGVFMKPIAGTNNVFDGGIFRFNTLTMGLKFFPAPPDRPNADSMEANLGVTVPYTYNWWQYHVGSIAGQFNYYL